MQLVIEILNTNIYIGLKFVIYRFTLIEVNELVVVS